MYLYNLSVGFVLEKGWLPLCITKRVTPAANKSDYKPLYVPFSISGGLYPGVPKLVVRIWFLSYVSRFLANPKSVNLIL